MNSLPMIHETSISRPSRLRQTSINYPRNVHNGYLLRCLTEIYYRGKMDHLSDCHHGSKYPIELWKFSGSLMDVYLTSIMEVNIQWSHGSLLDL